MKKRVLAVNAPAYDQSKAFFPPEIAYLVSAFKKNGIQCDVFDANFDKDMETDVIESIPALYDFVCIFADCYPFPYSDDYAFPYMLRIARQIKKVADIPVLIGGRYATLHHKEIVSCHNCFDIVVRGDVERIVVDIYNDYFHNGGFSTAFPGATYLKFQGEQKISDVIRLEEDLDELPFPSQKVQERYLVKKLADGSCKRFISIMSSRGCPYHCKYCSSTIYKRKWTARSPENVAEEVYAISQKYGNVIVKFADDNFYVDLVRAKSIINQIAEKCNRIIEFTFCARADQIVKHGMENLLFFKKHGCNSIEIGIENGSSNSLLNYGKETTVEQNIRALNMVRNAKIFPSVDYILFEPETSINDLKKNLTFIKSQLWGYYHPVLYSKIVPLEGTQYEKYRYLSEEQYFTCKDVYHVYTSMNQFRSKYQNRINALIDIMNSVQSNNVTINKRQYILLRTLPYMFFSELITHQTWDQKLNFVDTFSLKEQVDEKLALIEQQICL